jgi:hypothetical protein
VDQPGYLDLLLREVKSRMKSGGGEVSATTPPAAASPADQLRELASLRDDGIITEEEFEAKKKQLLGLE